MVLCLAGGCSSVLNPSFLALFPQPAPSDDGTVPQNTLENAPGHVAIMLVNNTQFDQVLLNYLASTGTDISDPNLRPRIRLRVNIEFTNGTSNTIELIDGSSVVEATFVGNELALPPELTEFTLTNVVPVCDVQLVSPVQVEVFVPNTVTTIQLVETENNVTREVDVTVPPSFQTLEPDEVDDNNNVELVRNFDIRNRPVPVNNVQCGSVVAFEISGVLRLSFTNFDGNFIPGFLDTDDASQASNPGRFEFVTTVR